MAVSYRNASITASRPAASPIMDLPLQRLSLTTSTVIAVSHHDAFYRSTSRHGAFYRGICTGFSHVIGTCVVTKSCTLFGLSKVIAKAIRHGFDSRACLPPDDRLITSSQ
ncbi:hypothetical protein CPAR01_10979 [Colletotrichum paranaense]|uniref:Uncharacterized protein n=1 Tax=Colletotrichum paranaense TaxID=1914294 RepID=A0ABQ9SAB5_9PEZI|nr:uncharacterized protein CPAR01_10979 [Colletotrichum paranaense]KAK1531330.1 hypothetical protein CPAR01_10979 [Colletotrichum paranaense]